MERYPSIPDPRRLDMEIKYLLSNKIRGPWGTLLRQSLACYACPTICLESVNALAFRHFEATGKQHEFCTGGVQIKQRFWKGYLLKIEL
jgi:hypothetical protein